MSRMSRRAFLGAVSSAPLAAMSCRSTGARASASAARDRRAHVDLVSFGYEDFHYRTPIKFGGRELDRATLLNVDCVLSGPGGRTARGFGSMPLGNVWSFPSSVMSYDTTLGAMKALASRICDL